MDAKRKIPFSKMLAHLRSELLQTKAEGEEADLEFLIQDIEIELQIATTQEGEGGVGIKFWVLDANAKIKGAEVQTQQIKLKLKAVDAEGSNGVKIRSQATQRPD